MCRGKGTTVDHFLHAHCAPSLSLRRLSLRSFISEIIGRNLVFGFFRRPEKDDCRNHRADGDISAFAREIVAFLGVAFWTDDLTLHSRTLFDSGASPV